MGVNFNTSYSVNALLLNSSRTNKMLAQFSLSSSQGSSASEKKATSTAAGSSTKAERASRKATAASASASVRTANVLSAANQSLTAEGSQIKASYFGNDTATVSGAGNTVYTSLGNDTITSSATTLGANNLLLAGAGNDTISLTSVTSFGANTRIDGGAEEDTLALNANLIKGMSVTTDGNGGYTLSFANNTSLSVANVETFQLGDVKINEKELFSTYGQTVVDVGSDEMIEASTANTTFNVNGTGSGIYHQTGNTINFSDKADGNYVKGGGAANLTFTGNASDYTFTTNEIDPTRVTVTNNKTGTKNELAYLDQANSTVTFADSKNAISLTDAIKNSAAQTRTIVDVTKSGEFYAENETTTFNIQAGDTWVFTKGSGNIVNIDAGVKHTGILNNDKGAVNVNFAGNAEDYTFEAQGDYDILVTNKQNGQTAILRDFDADQANITFADSKNAISLAEAIQNSAPQKRETVDVTGKFTTYEASSANVDFNVSGYSNTVSAASGNTITLDENAQENTIDGMYGVNAKVTFKLAGSQSDYTISDTGNGSFTITNKSNNNTTYLKNLDAESFVEFASSNETISLSQATATAQNVVSGKDYTAENSSSAFNIEGSGSNIYYLEGNTINFGTKADNNNIIGKGAANFTFAGVTNDYNFSEDAKNPSTIIVTNKTTGTVNYLVGIDQAGSTVTFADSKGSASLYDSVSLRYGGVKP